MAAGRPIIERSSTVRTVTQDDIRAYGARTLDEALALLPGVQIRTGGAGVPRVDVRGFRGRHVVLLLDGIPLNSTFDGQADPSLIPVEEIAEIKLMPGTGSVLYEQGGLGGVINIVTRRGTPGLAIELGGERRAGDAWLGRGTVSGAASSTSFFISGSAFDSDGFPSLTGSPSVGPSADRLRLNSDRRRSNVFASATASPTDRLRLGAVVAASHAALGLPPNAITDPTDRFANRPVFERIDAQDGLSGQVAASYAFSPAVALRSWAFLNRLTQQDNRFDDSTYTTMDDSTVRGTFREHNRTRLSGVAAQLAVTAGRVGALTIATSAQRDAWDLDGTIRDVQMGGAGGGGGGGGGRGGAGGTRPVWYALRALNDARSMRRNSVAIDYQVQPLTRFGVAAGYAHRWLTKDSSGSDDAGVASASAFVDITRRSHLRVATARTIRFPTVRQLYDLDGGNPDLRTEHATTAEIGIEQALARRSTLGVTVFRTHAEDYIERPAPGEPFANYDDYLFRGIEAVAETRAMSRLFLRAAYTHLETEDQSPGASRAALQYRPRHRASIEARYAFPFGLETSASALRVIDQVYYSRQAPVDARRLPDYTLAAIRVALPLLRGTSTVYAGADNLFDAHYEEEYGSPAATRVVYVGASFRLQPIAGSNGGKER